MSITTVLTAFKTALQSIDPSPQSAPAVVYAHPTDTADMKYNIDGVFEQLPAIVVEEHIGGEQYFVRETMRSYKHTWQVATLIFLEHGHFKDQIASVEVDKLIPGWLTGYARMLRSGITPTDGLIELAGPGDRLFTVPRKGHIEWNGQFYWGIPIITTVTQVVT